MKKRTLSSLALHRPILETSVAAVLPWLALFFLAPGFSLWPSSLTGLAWLVLGAAYTHLFEYAYHRWLMHGPVPVLKFIRESHRMHHRIFYGEHFDSRDPRALKHVSGHWFLFPVAFLAHFFVLEPILPMAALSSFLGGVLAHYLVFELTHWFAHVADNDFDRLVGRLPVLGQIRQIQLRHHRLHHETPELDFNFVPPFAADRLGSTFLVPGECTETSEGPCFVPGTMRLRTPFDPAQESPSEDGITLAGPLASSGNPNELEPAEERRRP